MLQVVVDARDAYAPQLRGWGRYARRLIEALDGEPGIELTRVTSGWPGPESAFELLGLPLRARRADVLHVPNCFLSPLRLTPGVVTIHDLAFEDHPQDFARATALKYRTWTPRAARSAQVVITPSGSTRDDLVERYRIDPRKIHVIPEAPALPLSDAEPPAGPYLLGVGDLRKKKDFVTLAGAYARLRAGGLPQRLIIAGVDAGEADAIRGAAGGNPLELPGYVDDAALDALIRGADALVHPSLYEGFGLVLVEAMARDTPVAFADATALPETAAGAGAPFAPRDPDACAAAIETVLANPARWIERGRARVAELSWQRAARATIEAYEAALR